MLVNHRRLSVSVHHQQLRHLEAPRLHQRGEGSRADHSRDDNRIATSHARSLGWLKNAVLRDHAIAEDEFDARRR